MVRASIPIDQGSPRVPSCCNCFLQGMHKGMCIYICVYVYVYVFVYAYVYRYIILYRKPNSTPGPPSFARISL